MSAYTTSIRTVSGSYRRVAGHPVVAAIAAASVMAATAVVVVAAIVLSSRGSAGGPLIPVQVQPAVDASGLTLSRSNGAYLPHTIYIVGSEEQAARVSGDINGANVIRSAFHENSLVDEVIVAVSDDEAAAVVSAENDANAILVAEYGVENRIIDMR